MGDKDPKVSADKDPELSRKARLAITKARTQLIIQQPFFGTLALQLGATEVNDGRVDTMAVDGRHLYYHPPFVVSLTDNECMGVIAHEVLHCAYQHMGRRQARDPILWNIAGDFVINDDLLKANFTLPKERLHDPQYAGMSTEEVYERLKKNARVIKLYIKGDGKGDGKGKGGKGGGMDPGRCGGVIDPEGGQVQQDNVSNEWEAIVRMAVNVAKGANAGQLPGHLERLIKTLDRPRVNWRDRTQKWIDGNMHKDYSWSNPNRRYVALGLTLPGHIPDALHHLVMVIDISGSISGELMRAMVSEGAGALDQGVADKLTIIYADTRVCAVDEYNPGDLVEARAIGGGGTAFAASFKWIEKNASDASCIVYLTDMCTSEWGEDIGIPTLWGAYLPESQLGQYMPPFGEVVLIDSSQ